MIEINFQFFLKIFIKNRYNNINIKKCSDANDILIFSIYLNKNLMVKSILLIANY